MATSAGTCADIVALLMESPQAPGRITARKMFGEYGLYCDGLFFGLICDDLLYVKPVPAARAAMIEPAGAPPYPKAKPHLLIGPEDMADPDHLARLVGLVLAGLRPD